MPRLTKEQRERAPLCRFPGCTHRWVTTFSPIGPVCHRHMPMTPKPSQKIPTTPPARPWSEPEETEE